MIDGVTVLVGVIDILVVLVGVIVGVIVLVGVILTLVATHGPSVTIGNGVNPTFSTHVVTCHGNATLSVLK